MTTTAALPSSTEIAVVGASFAGLSAALTLGRAQRQVLILGAGPTRNAESLHSHNLLTREGASPSELLATAHAEIAALPTVTFLQRWVTSITEDGASGTGPLRLDLADGATVTAEAVLLATGARDALPDVPGLVELWGRRAHSCPFCDAGLYAGRRLALLADEPAAGHMQALFAGWTDQRTVIAPADVAQLTEDGEDVVVALTDGREVRVDGVFAQTTPLPRLDAVAGLTLDRRGPFLAVERDHRTTVPGLWAAGDCAWADGAFGPGGQVVQAMADGSVAAISIIFSSTGLTPPAVPERTSTQATPPPTSQAHDDQPADARTFWEDRYAEADRIWSGRPSRGLVEAVQGTAPGRALELGCGEGADAIWLAEQGWQVDAVDLSATALDRASRTADGRGVGDRITWRQADLAEGLPSDVVAPAHDLVLAAHLLSPVDLPRDKVLRQAAAAVAEGGLLVILSHLAPPPGTTPHRGGHHELPDLDTQLERLQLDEGWTVVRAEAVDIRYRAPDGTVATRPDTVLVLRRGA